MLEQPKVLVKRTGVSIVNVGTVRFFVVIGSSIYRSTHGPGPLYKVTNYILEICERWLRRNEG